MDTKAQALRQSEEFGLVVGRGPGEVLCCTRYTWVVGVGWKTSLLEGRSVCWKSLYMDANCAEKDEGYPVLIWIVSASTLFAVEGLPRCDTGICGSLTSYIRKSLSRVIIRYLTFFSLCM